MSAAPWIQRVQIGDCTLYQGDCLAAMETLEPVDHTISDSPYEAIMHKAKAVAVAGCEPCFLTASTASCIASCDRGGVGITSTPRSTIQCRACAGKPSRRCRSET